MAKKKKSDFEDMPVDIDSIDWEKDYNFKTRQKLFIYYYCLPNSSTWQSPLESAKKAGYKIRYCYLAESQIMIPEVRNQIKKILNDKVVKKIDDMYNDVIQDLANRQKCNVMDFYRSASWNDEETGQTHNSTSIIPLDELSPDKAKLIENVEINQAGIATYKLPNKDKVNDIILKLHKDAHANQDSTEFDVETTVDIIKENLATVKTTIMQKNQKIRENAQNYLENDENLPEYD